MAIQRKQYGGQQSNNITEPGEYVVKIIDKKLTMSKAKVDKDGKEKPPRPMVVLTFETATGAKINGYYVKELAFHMEALKDCMVACGLPSSGDTDELLQKKCGIAVEKQKPGPDGRSFMSITGYGRASDVEQKQARANDDFHHHEEPSQDHDDPFGPPPEFL